MNQRKRLVPALVGITLLGVGYAIIAPISKQSIQETSMQNTAIVDAVSDMQDNSIVERYKQYEPFGMTYNVDEDKLFYKDQPVRWFEDYYVVGNENEQAGIDFFNEEGSIDVYAIRNFDDIERALDGSYDPSGTLVGLEAFSEEAFQNRDIEKLKMPQITSVAIGETTEIDPNAQTFAERFEPYKTVGIRYEESEVGSGVGNVYYNEELVHHFVDISPQGGTFTFESKDQSSLDVQTLYDDQGYLMGIEIIN